MPHQTFGSRYSFCYRGIVRRKPHSVLLTPLVLNADDDVIRPNQPRKGPCQLYHGFKATVLVRD